MIELTLQITFAFLTGPLPLAYYILQDLGYVEQLSDVYEWKVYYTEPDK